MSWRYTVLRRETSWNRCVRTCNKVSPYKINNSLLCTKLQKSGYLEKSQSPDDKRFFGFRLTQMAVSLENNFQEISDNMNSVLTRGFSDQEIVLFERMLSRARENFESELTGEKS